MMVNYVYAVTEPATGSAIGPTGGLGRGLEDEQVVQVVAGGVAAACTCHARLRPRPAPEALWRHEEVVERLATAGPVLPVRFGSTFPTTGEVARVLAQHEEELRRALELVRGRVEVGVRVRWQPPAEAPESGPAVSATAAPGRAYLERRLDAQRRDDARRAAANERAKGIHLPLAAMAATDRCDVLVQPGLLLSGAYLVDVEELDDFRRAVELLAAAEPDLDVLCTGPWPAHSFAPALDRECARA